MLSEQYLIRDIPSAQTITAMSTAHVNGKCQQPMSTANVNSKCQQQISTANVNSKCQQQMSTANVNSKCRLRMSTANVNGKCQQQMSTANVNSKCQQQMSTANVNCACQMRMSRVNSNSKCQLRISTAQLTLLNTGFIVVYCRYLAVCHPHYYRNISLESSTTRRLMTYIIPVLGLSLIINLPRFFETEFIYEVRGRKARIEDSARSSLYLYPPRFNSSNYYKLIYVTTHLYFQFYSYLLIKKTHFRTTLL